MDFGQVIDLQQHRANKHRANNRRATMTKEDQEQEQSVVEMMVESKTIARSLFGENNDGCIATHEIYDYLNGGADPEEFATDLKRVIEHAKRLHNIPSPTPAQVFGLFERIFAEEE